jgi:hypothetical protein
MDNHSFSNAIHVFIDQHPDNEEDTEDMPELVSLDALGSPPTQPQQRNSTDVEMNNHDNNQDSESNRDAHEVELQIVNDRSLSDHAGPNPSTSHISQDQPSVNNRRARVEDDEDEDRDRRHPSQRVGSSTNATSPAVPSSSSTPLLSSQLPRAAPTPGARLRGQAPIFSRAVVDEVLPGRAHPFRFFQHLMSNNNNNNDNNNGAGNTNSDSSAGGAGPVPAPPQPPLDRDNPHNQPHGRFEAFSVTVDIGLGPPFPVGGGAQPSEGQPIANAADPNLNPNAQNLNNFSTRMADIMASLGYVSNTAPGGNNPPQGPGTTFPGIPEIVPVALNLGNIAGFGLGFNLDGSGFGEKEDPERARKLVDGLEEVSVGLVRRLERVGGTGGGMGEDETKGGDGGCAICWDRLLGSEEDVRQQWKSQKSEESARTPEASGEASRPKIVSLPCAHVFHADCLIPWFSRPRQTTCPTCRFNIDPENLTYVSWRRRMRERQERERAEARARGDPEDTNENEASQNSTAAFAAATATAASEQVQILLSTLQSQPATAVSEEVVEILLSSLQSQPVQPTPDAPVTNVHPTATPRSQSLPPASSSSFSSSPGPSSQPTNQAPSQEAANDWDNMPGLEDVSDSNDDDDDDDDEENDEGDEDEYEDEEAGDQALEEIQAPPLLPNTNEPPISSTPGPQEQAQAPQPRQNDPLAPRTIQTAHGLITLIPVPFNFPFSSAGNGVGVGVQAGGNAANANAQVPPAAGQGLANVNANANTQALPRAHVAFPHFHVELPHMPEFGAQRGAPVPANTATNNANVNTNSDQAVPANTFVDADLAAAITSAEAHFMQHLRSQGLTANEAENIRRSTMIGRQADRLRRGEHPDGVDLDLEEDEEDMMDIDEGMGMGMVVDLTMNQGVGGDGIGMTAGPVTQDGQDRQDFDHVMNLFNHAARQAHEQAQAGTQPQGQGQQPEPRTQAATTAGQSAQQPQPQAQRQQGQGLPVNFGNFGNFGNLRPGGGRTLNDFFSQMFSNLGGPQQQAQPAQPAQRQDNQPQPQAQAPPPRQAGAEPDANPNTANINSNGGRPRQQAQFAFGNLTFGNLFAQVPSFDPNGNGNANRGAGQERVKKAWTLPPAPGPTLRQRIERKERDAGFRCYDVSCGVGPSDDDPAVNDETIAAGLRQLVIMSKTHGNDGKPGVCMHTFHPGCLVSAERVALGGADVSVIASGDVEVSCPVCRSTGCVTKKEWEEGILALA